MIRSVAAILAGIATLTITSFAIEAVADPLMMRLLPPALPDRAAISQNLAATSFLSAYTAICVTAGGYVTACIARRSQIRHAIIMGSIEEALTVWAMLSIGKQAPVRNWVGALVSTIPAAWLGAALRLRQIKKGGSPRQLPRTEAA